jgi:hypothetical protein
MAIRPTTATTAPAGDFRRRLTALVAVYGLLAQILLGALAAAVGPAAALAGDRSALAQIAELCTPNGLVRVAVGAPSGEDGRGADPGTPKCPLCLGGQGAALAPSGDWTLQPPLASSRPGGAAVPVLAPPGHYATELRPRAPPAA